MTIIPSDDQIAEHMELDLDDLSWAKPLVDEARASIARGEGMTLDDYRARMTERFGSGLNTRLIR